MPRSPLLRPTLLPGLPRIWRGPHTLQLGLDPARAVLVDLPDPRAARVLDLLDGTRPERVVLARAAQLGVPADETRALLDTLHAAGFVVGAHTLLPAALPDDARHGSPARPRRSPCGPPAGRPRGTRRRSPAQVLRRRAAARVVVAGRGRLAAPVAVALAQAGVGHVHADLAGHVTPAELPGGPLTAAETGRPRADAVAAGRPTGRAGHRDPPGTTWRSVPGGPARLRPARRAARRRTRRVAVRRTSPCRSARVRRWSGPLVPPTGAPCLNCLDLHRTERDADWPQLAAQIGDPAPEPCSVVTLLAATAYATAEALAFLDGGTPETLGAAVEICAPGRFRRRTWTPHPACGCARRRRPNRSSPDRGPSSGL